MSAMHTRAGKRAFIRALCRSVAENVAAAVPAMPAEWDGHELRELLAEVFDRERSGQMKQRPLSSGYNRRRVLAYRKARARMSQ